MSDPIARRLPQAGRNGTASRARTARKAFLYACILLLALAFSASAQAIKVRGKVTDAAGKPLAEATVELARAKLKATTGADGLYSLGAGTGLSPGAGVPGEIRFERGSLELNVNRAVPVRVAIYDVNGNLLDGKAFHLARAGTYRLELPGINPGKNLLLVRVSLGGYAKAFPYFPMARGRGAAAGPEYLGAARPLAKQAAFVDTLKAAAAGYQPKSFALASYDLTQDIRLEAAAGCTAPTPPAAKDAVTLDMNVSEGPPSYLASGFIYGIAQDGVQPPTALLKDIKVQGFRAGRGSGGCGEANWKAHWKVMKAYYSRAKELGVPMLLLLSDDYQYNCPLPGEGGNWTTFDAFLDQLIDSVKANGMTGSDVRWEIWNESDYSPTFWTGTQAQWLETWKHAYQRIRAALPSAVIEGPSFATGASGSWMNVFLDYAKANNVVPDVISWHIAGGGGDPANDAATITSRLSSKGITGVKSYDLNEYGSQTEQNPGHSAWFLARFDRVGIQGMRSNWSTAPGFFANMGNLVTTNWQPNSQYWVYKRYADQTGLRIQTTAGSRVDALGYADMAAGRAIIIVGNRGGSTGAINVVVKNVPSWLQSGGTTKVLLEKMPTGNGASTGPTVLSNAAATVSCNTLIVTLDWATAADAFVLTLTPN